MPKLSKVLYQVGKTINLAKPSAYQVPRKPPLNTLIFEKLPEQRCGDKITSCVKGPSPTKPVRVCTKEEAQSFYCPPIPCDCKIKPPPLTFSQKVGRLLKQTVKALIVGGIIYYTYKEGIWSDAFRSSCFLGKFLEECPEEEDETKDKNEFADLTDFTLDDPEPCWPFIPQTSILLYKLGKYWNHMIITMFWVILDAPSELLSAWLNLFKPKPKVTEEKLCIPAKPM